MKVIDKAHHYELKNLEKGSQKLLFIKKEVGATGNFRTVHDGTTNEEVIEALIDRIDTLDKRFPSDFNKEALKGLRNSLHALLSRTADRENRGVEGTPQK